jgi:hypothetical protein
MNGYQKMCDTNKNVTKMGIIIRGFIIEYVNQILPKKIKIVSDLNLVRAMKLLVGSVVKTNIELIITLV